MLPCTALLVQNAARVFAPLRRRPHCHLCACACLDFTDLATPAGFYTLSTAGDATGQCTCDSAWHCDVQHYRCVPSHPQGPAIDSSNSRSGSGFASHQKGGHGVQPVTLGIHCPLVLFCRSNQLPTACQIWYVTPFVWHHQCCISRQQSSF